MQTFTIKINERSKAGIAFQKMLEILKNKPGVQEHIVSVDVLTAMGHYSDK